MKITVTAEKRATLTLNAYEPVAVQSSVSIERDVSDDTDVDKFVEKQNEKLNNLLDKNIDMQMRSICRKQKDVKSGN